MAEVKKKITRTKKTAPVAKPTKKATKKIAVNPVSSSLTNLKTSAGTIWNKLANTPKKYQYGAVILVLTILILAYFKSFFVAAIVNGQPIPRWTVISQLEKEGGQKALDNLISKTLIQQEASKKKVAVSTAEIDEEINKIKDSLQNQGQNYEEAISAEGFTDASLRENIRLNKTVTKLVENDIQVTDEDVKKYREENKEAVESGRSSIYKDKSEAEIDQLIKEDLQSTQRSEKIQELVTRLKNEAKINYWVSY